LYNDPVRNVVIVGGGTAGWMCAAGLSRMLDMRGLSVTLIESDEIGTIGVGEATIPSLHVFNQLLGLDEADFMRQTRATIKLGIEFTDWGKLGDHYIHPFGDYGLDRPDVKFHQMWLKLLHAGADVGAIGDYNMCLMAARLNRFGIGQMRRGLPDLRHAYHLDAGLYARYLRRYAEQRGIVRREGLVTNVNQREDGFVSSVTLRDGQVVEGDLFVDCSGFRALLIGQTLGVGFEDWGRWLPCDRAVAMPCENTGPLIPYTRATADAAGWRWRIQLQHRIGNGHVYSSAYIDSDTAEARLRATLDGAAMSDPLHIRFKPGHRHRLWDRNVIAIGLSGGFIEPLESTSIHLIQTGVSRLLLLFPDMRFTPALIDEFNRSSLLEYEQIRDFIILHYKATRRDDTPFWRYCRDMEVPDSLRHKMELFRAGGRIFRFSDDLFTESSWLAVLLGQGIVPECHDPVADAIPAGDMERALLSLRAAVLDAAKALPDHTDFIRSYCAI